MSENVLIAEANDLFRNALCQILRSADGAYTIAGQANSGPEALAEMGRLQPDLLIFGLHLPQLNGFVVMAAARHRWPDANILVLTLRRDAVALQRSLAAGADGYCTKTNDRPTILEAVAEVASGGVYISPGMRANQR